MARRRRSPILDGLRWTRFQCTVCGKVSSGRVPRDDKHKGDGTIRFPRRHKHEGEPCPGNILAAKWVEVDRFDRIVRVHTE